MKVLFIDSVHSKLQERLTAENFICVDGTSFTEAQLDEVIHLYDGLVIRSRFTMHEARLKLATNLKFIARAGSGMENIDIDYCQKNNIQCFNAPEANCVAVGEHAIGMILSLFNKFLTGNEEMKSGLWKREENRGLELGQRTVGIIGYGHNGKAFTRILSGFGTKVLVYDKYVPVKEEGNIRSCSLDEMKSQCDLISFHVPLTEETKYYFDKEFLSQMARPFYLINTSRGEVVETDVLVEGLKSKKVLGACLDVLEYEKSSFEKMNLELDSNSSMNYLLNADNVVLSPHVAGWTKESLLKLSEVLADKILDKFSK